MAGAPDPRYFDLSRDTSVSAPTQDVAGARHLFVAQLPAAAAGLALLSIDGSTPVPIARGDRFDAAAGDGYKQIAILCPAVGGIAVVLCGGDESIPSSGGAVTQVQPYFSALWMPHEAAAEAGALSTAWMGAGGVLSSAPPFWTVSVFGGVGQVPVMTNGGNRAAYHRSNAGQVAVRLGLFDYAWRRARTDVRTVTSRPDPQMIRIRLQLLKLAAGGVKGIGSGVWFAPADTTFPGSPSTNNPFVGISQDGAGNYRARSRHLGGAGLDFDGPISWPTTQDQFVKLTIELWDADPVLGRDGIARILVNDVLVAAITDPAVLPMMSGAQTGYAFLVQDEGANAQCQAFSRCRVDVGPIGMAA